METGGPIFYNNKHFNDDLEERSAEERAIDDWLPITHSRRGRWWFSTVHIVTAVVGAGVLGLPYDMSELGWGAGTAVLVISWIVALYSLWQMVEMHEIIPGKRFDRYHELGQHAFGQTLGLWIVVPPQLICLVGVDIVYMIIGGQSLSKFHDLVCQDCHHIKLMYFILIFGSVHFLLSQLPSFNSISGVSLAAAVMSVSYSTIAWGASVDKGVLPDVDYGRRHETKTDSIFNFFSALGAIAFAYGGHNVVMEIQATMPSTENEPSKKPMWKGVILAYIIIGMCYIPVAMMGYWIFGSAVSENILITLQKPKWLIAAANMFVVGHLIGGYQIYAMAVFDMIEGVLVRKLKFKPTWLLRFISRTSYVAFTVFMGITFPSFIGFLGFFGGFGLAPTTYLLPCIIWLAIVKPRRFSFSWFANWLDERCAEERAIDDWLPITHSRRGRWWFSTVHNVTAIVGAGVLGLPYNMSKLGWVPGVAALILSWITTLYSLWQMVEMHEIVPGKRFDRYHELGQHAFGQKLGLWIVVPPQLICLVGVDIVYMITGGQSLAKFHHLVCQDCDGIKLTYFILVFASVHFVLSQLPSFNSISGVSLAAAVMSISYSTIAWGASVKKGVKPGVQYGYKSETVSDTIFNFFSGLGSVAFAYGGHNVVMEIQATMPSTQEKPSKIPMWKGVIFAYVVIGVCYIPVAVTGYWIFGNAVDENILLSLQQPRWLVATANMLVVVHLVGGYQINAMPVFDMIEAVLVKKLKFKPNTRLRIISRTSYVAFTMLVGITLPFFDGLLGFLGGFGFAPNTYFLPCVIWLVIFRPRRFSLSWFANWFCIIFGVVLMILGAIGGLRQIILHAKTYKLYG
ncbi:hypothetical protein AAHA92_14017 [Salvia divinorum]|uniref:Amino acid transporter transmembrane domain-containing protein n=1 Tax=Salvia divinorum TaxID=28513 RepID=A0ABD1HA55_SALDI